MTVHSSRPTPPPRRLGFIRILGTTLLILGGYFLVDVVYQTLSANVIAWRQVAKGFVLVALGWIAYSRPSTFLGRQ
jgi:hypothetical protein